MDRRHLPAARLQQCILMCVRECVCVRAWVHMHVCVFYTTIRPCMYVHVCYTYVCVCFMMNQIWHIPPSFHTHFTLIPHSFHSH